MYVNLFFGFFVTQLEHAIDTFNAVLIMPR